jgi:hypothetical protein
MAPATALNPVQQVEDLPRAPFLREQWFAHSTPNPDTLETVQSFSRASVQIHAETALNPCTDTPTDAAV